MKIRNLALIAAMTALAGLSAIPASAQNVDAVKARQEAMKSIGGTAKAASRLLKGEVAFDPAAAAELFASMSTHAKTFEASFPADSKTGGDTEASPKVWEKPEEFKAKLVKFETDIGAAIAAKPATLDAFKASFGAVASNCKGCHEEYRVEK